MANENLFLVTGVDTSGKKIKIRIKAESESEAAVQSKRHGIFPTAVKATSEPIHIRDLKDAFRGCFQFREMGKGEQYFLGFLFVVVVVIVVGAIGDGILESRYGHLR